MKSSIRSKTNTVILIDFNNQVWRSHHATLNKMAPNSDGIHTGSILGLTKTLMHAINQTKSLNSMPELVICEDRVPTRKRELYETYQDAFKEYDGIVRYKGNRPSKDLDYNPVQICSEFMSCIPHNRVYCEGEEADDVLASYVSNNKNSKILMYSTDRDMWQLLDKFPNLTIFFDPDGSKPTSEYMMKKFQTTSFNKVALHKIIRGDPGDNVKSVKGYQFKRSLEAWEACNHTIENYLHYIIKIFGEDSPYIKKLLLPHNIRLMELNRKLVALKTNLDYDTEVFKVSDFEKWKHLCHTFETPSLLRAKLMEIF